ncbi:radical SAM protein [Umezawaea tangerina]|uniref:Radical SAM protein with 4Fe4S-binding SPASM domain n=1 Tax=Umezawaea tangerina TaxID=84725 RepID=A0A2T0SU74_9PSEU|nr:radical SAM protein [Umezawaea tangerina]PRY36948.1 radical SAM protein with 4Fe4S-binding SPASM domain [Umezawaea tangerina]
MTDNGARAENHDLNIVEFERRATVLTSMPRVLFIELTENCNLSCPMCRSAGPFQPSRNMSTELFDRVAEELFPTAEIVDLRGWGESTILKRFPEFVDKTLAHGCRIRLVTNLTVPNEQLWRKLVRSGALIAVSFDAGEPETFEILRKGAKFDVVMRNLRILADEARVSGVGTDNIHLNVVVQPAALAELTQIVRVAAELGIKVQLNPLTTGEDDPDNLVHHREELLAELTGMAEAARELDVDVQINAALDPLWAQDAHADKTCTHPWMYCYVNYRGQVGFCDHLIGAPAEQHLLGDLTTTKFDDIWNGSAYQRLRAEHALGRDGLSEQFEECKWCYHNRYVDFDETSYEPYQDHRVALTPALCGGFTPAPSVQVPSRHTLPLAVVPSGNGNSKETP